MSTSSEAEAEGLKLVAAAGDAVVLLGFAAIGRSSHREAEGGPIFGLLGTAAPFLFGWFILPRCAYEAEPAKPARRLVEARNAGTFGRRSSDG